jgi:hypothetical protein
MGMDVNQRVIVEIRERNVKTGGGIKQYVKEIDESRGRFKKHTKVWQDLNMAGKRVGKVHKEITSNFKAFRMELLSVMFGVQMLNREMISLLQPALETFGVFDLFRAMLQLLFIPIVEYMFPLFLDLFQMFTDLPEPVKLAIGAFVGLIAAVTAILASGAALGLFRDGIVNAFGSVNEAFIKTRDLIGAGLSFKFLYGGFKDLSEGKILAGISESLTGLAWFFPKKYGNALFSIGAGLKVVELLGKGGKLTNQDFIDMFAIAAIAGVKFGPTGLIVSGSIILTIMNWDKIKQGIKDLFSTDGYPFPFGAVKILRRETGFDPNTGLFNTPTQTDFIWRAGQGVTSISPDDDIIGAKDLSRVGGGITINQTNNISAFDAREIERMIQLNNSRLVDDIRRQVGA